MNGWLLVSGDAGSSESEVRGGIGEDEGLEALMAVAANAGIAVCVWVLTNGKRQGPAVGWNSSTPGRSVAVFPRGGHTRSSRGTWRAVARLLSGFSDRGFTRC